MRVLRVWLGNSEVQYLFYVFINLGILPTLRPQISIVDNKY